MVVINKINWHNRIKYISCSCVIFRLCVCVDKYANIINNYSKQNNISCICSASDKHFKPWSLYHRLDNVKNIKNLNVTKMKTCFRLTVERIYISMFPSFQSGRCVISTPPWNIIQDFKVKIFIYFFAKVIIISKLYNYIIIISR